MVSGGLRGCLWLEASAGGDNIPVTLLLDPTGILILYEAEYNSLKGLLNSQYSTTETEKSTKSNMKVNPKYNEGLSWGWGENPNPHMSQTGT